MQRGAVLLTLVAVLGAAGCLDEEKPLECPTATPIGGDPTGRWEVLDICVNTKPDFLEGCPAARIEIVGITGAGTLDYRADGTYHDQTQLIQSAEIDAPLSCFPRAKSCYDLGTLLTSETRKPAGSATPTQVDVVRTFCRGTDQCRCAYRSVTTFDERATYKRNGTELQVADGTLRYSVIGNELRVQTDGIFARLVRY
jgi:hypothetical protein